MKLARQMLIESLTLGRVTEDLAALAMEVGQMAIYSDKNVNLHNKQDACGAFYVKFMRNWRKIDPDGNIKAYISLMATNTLIDKKRSFKANREKNIKFYDNKVINASNKVQQKEITEETLLEKLGIKNGKTMTKKERLSVRREFLRMLKQGMSQYRMALVIGINEGTISRWKKAYETDPNKFVYADKRRKSSRKRIKGK